MNNLWFTYLAFALVALLWKYLRFVIQGRRVGRSAWESTIEWVFEPTAENASSWLLGTIVITWVLGAIWIDSLVIGFFDQVVGIPHHHSMAAALGFGTEQLAPAAVKALLNFVAKKLHL